VPYLLIHKLFENLSTLTVIVRPLAQSPRRLENGRAARMLRFARPERGVSFSSVIFGSHPGWHPALAALYKPSLEQLRGVAICLGRRSRGTLFSIHSTPISRLFVSHGPLSRTGRDLALNFEVKVCNCFGVPLRVCVPAATGIRPVDQASACFIMRAATMDDEGWWRLGL
jgi:hypothetical protein